MNLAPTDPLTVRLGAAIHAGDGADINATPDYSGQTTLLDIAGSQDTRRAQLVSWLKERGAQSARGSAAGD